MNKNHVLSLGVLAAAFAIACSPSQGAPKKKDGGKTRSGYVDPEGEYEEDEWPGDGDEGSSDAGHATQPEAGGSIIVDAGIPDVAPPPNAAPTSIVYSAPLPIGIDHRSIVTTVLDAQNALSGYKWSDAEAPLRGSLKVADAQSTTSSNDSSFLSWGRWLSGESGGAFYGTSIKLTGFQGFHYVAGTAATNLPKSGDLTFAPFPGGATLATADDASLGFPTLQKAEAKVRFGDDEAQVAFALTLDTRDGPYTITTTGATNDPAQSELVTFSGANDGHVFGGYAPAVGAGPACGGSCAALVRGFMSGTGAKGLAVAYVLGNGPSAIRGVVAMRR